MAFLAAIPALFASGAAAAGTAAAGAGAIAAPAAGLSLSTLGTSLALAGGVTSAIGTYGAGKAQADAYSTNADIARIEGKQAMDETHEQERLSREKSARLMSKQRAFYGASGVDIASGSPLDVMADQAYQSEMDALNIRHMGELAKWKAGFQANQYDWMGKQANRAGKIAAFSTLMSTAGNTWLNSRKMKQPLKGEDDWYNWQTLERG